MDNTHNNMYDKVDNLLQQLSVAINSLSLEEIITETTQREMIAKRSKTHVKFIGSSDFLNKCCYLGNKLSSFNVLITDTEKVLCGYQEKDIVSIFPVLNLIGFPISEQLKKSWTLEDRWISFRNTVIPLTVKDTKVERYEFQVNFCIYMDNAIIGSVVICSEKYATKTQIISSLQNAKDISELITSHLQE